jgi:hypothetical protein
MITCIKIAAYELRPSGKDHYDYARDLGLQKIDPPSLAPNSIQPSSPIIYCSTQLRALQSIKVEPTQKLIKTDLLREIPFDLSRFCGRREYGIEKSSIVRKKFRENFILDSLPVTRERIFSELRQLLFQAEGEEATFISHSFRLKILQAVVATKGELVSNPQLLEKYLHDDQKTFEFGQSFTLSDSDLSTILF